MIGFRRALSLSVLILLGISTTSLHAALVDGGFEIGSGRIANPPVTAYGVWFEDEVYRVTAENGITPHQGSKMIRFVTTSRIALPSDRVASEASQWIDLATIPHDVSSGLVKASLSALFNRVAGDAQTDTEFRVRLVALSGTPAYYEFGDELAEAVGLVFTDSLASTWESASVDLLLPANTDYLAVQVIAFENIFEDQTSTEFDGHYADNAILSFAVVPELPSLSFVLIGCAAFAANRMRKCSSRSPHAL